MACSLLSPRLSHEHKKTQVELSATKEQVVFLQKQQRALVSECRSVSWLYDSARFRKSVERKKRIRSLMHRIKSIRYIGVWTTRKFVIAVSGTTSHDLRWAVRCTKTDEGQEYPDEQEADGAVQAELWYQRWRVYNVIIIGNFGKVGYVGMNFQNTLSVENLGAITLCSYCDGRLSLI